jgi:fucose permease
MDCLLCAASWRVSERVWDDDAVILLGGIADWQSRRASGLEACEEADLVLISLFVAGAGLVVIVVGSSLMTVSSGAGLTGLGLAAVFPTTFAIFTRHFGRQASQLTGFFSVLAGLGGALIPWLVGSISAWFGDLRIGLLIPLFCVAFMIVLQILIIRALAPGHLQSR